MIEPTLANSDIKAHIDNFTGIIKKKNGINLSVNVIQQKKLAWSCKKYKYAYLVHHNYVVFPSVVKEYENELRLIEPCILWQIILVKRNINTSDLVAMSDDGEYRIIPDSEECNIMKDMI